MGRTLCFIWACMTQIGLPAQSAWSIVPSGTTADLYSFNSKPKYVITGDSGIVLVSDDLGVTWPMLPVVTTLCLKDSKSASSHDCFVVGDDTMILFSRDSLQSWASYGSIPGPSPLSFNAVAGDLDSNARFFADSGFTLRIYDNVWYTGNLIGTEDLLDGNGTMDTMITCGTNGFIAQTADDGGSWSYPVSGTLEDLNGLYFSTSRSLICGNNGTILTDFGTLGLNWSPLNSGTTEDLNAIYAFGDTLFACGNGGTIINSLNGGLSWTIQSTPITSDLNDIYCVSSSDCWAVGDSGIILHTTTSGIPLSHGDHSMWGSVPQLIPNPCHDRTELRYGGPSSGRVIVADGSGRIVLDQAVMREGDNVTVLEIDTRWLSAGVYSVTLTSSSLRSVSMLVVEN